MKYERIFPPPYREQSRDSQSKSMDWFLYDRDLRHERVNMSKGQKMRGIPNTALIWKQVQQ